MHEQCGSSAEPLSLWLYFNNVLPIRKVWWDLTIMSFRAEFPLGSPFHLYADDVHPVSLPVIIGPTICKGVEYTPLLLSLREEVCQEVCSLMCSHCICPCVYLHLNTFVCDCTSADAVERYRVAKESLHLIGWNHKAGTSQMLIWKWRISLVLFLPTLSPPVRYWEGSPYIWGTLRLGLSFSPLDVALFHFSPYSGTIDPLSQVSISFPGETAPRDLVCVKVVAVLSETERDRQFQWRTPTIQILIWMKLLSHLLFPDSISLKLMLSQAAVENQ